eukprot:gnl/TRDRNA2_/TRDRNA2_160780_c0_seq1.p1 gnl/TRDRNA2_/TRDRNA2_160780_c0~~gnl/TRDRNA2_/TRDRNA2_160780_c0_seq1.p1  ORF type:complete len:356 (-),score=61.39 gnl/TRDRNA2_/TRDRNA2_160780_c0_seq1:52-1059(-)
MARVVLLSLLMAPAAAFNFSKAVVFGDSWMLRSALDGTRDTAWCHVLARKLGIPILPPFANHGATSTALLDLIENPLQVFRRTEREDPSLYGPDDLLLLHIGGNDLRPAISELWLYFFSRAIQDDVVFRYVRDLVQNLETAIDSMCRKPFRTFVVAEPPVTKYLPLIEDRVWDNNLEAVQQQIAAQYAEVFAADKWLAKGCRVIVFREGVHLDNLGDNEELYNYADDLHPDFEIHKRLGELLYEQLLNETDDAGQWRSAAADLPSLVFKPPEPANTSKQGQQKKPAKDERRRRRTKKVEEQVEETIGFGEVPQPVANLGEEEKEDIGIEEMPKEL